MSPVVEPIQVGAVPGPAVHLIPENRVRHDCEPADDEVEMGVEPTPKTGRGPFRISPNTAPDPHFRSVGLTGFEPATP